MKKNYIKASMVIIISTIIFIILLSLVIPFYRNKLIIGKKGTLLKDAENYYNVKTALFDYYNLLLEESSYEELNKTILYSKKLTYNDYEKIVSSYQSFDIYVDKIYNLGDNTFRCEYSLKKSPEASDVYLDSEELEDEKVYNNSVVIKFNKDFNKYKVIYNRLELNGGSVYEK